MEKWERRREEWVRRMGGGGGGGFKDGRQKALSFAVITGVVGYSPSRPPPRASLAVPGPTGSMSNMIGKLQKASGLITPGSNPT